MVAAIMTAAVTLVPGIGSAFRVERSPANRMNLNLNVGADEFETLGYGRQSFNRLAEMALSRWNAVGIGRTPDHSFFSVTSPGQPAAQCGPDRVSQVQFASADCDGFSFGDAIAVSVLWVRNGRVTETDVMFNQDIAWNGYPGPERRAPGGFITIDFFRVALHEFGHAFGLGHPDELGQVVTAIMNSRVGDTDDLQADDIAGAHAVAWSPNGGMGPVLAAALLPTSRSVHVGVPATAFATIINTAAASASNCRITPGTAIPAGFTFQTTSPTTNQTTGTPDTPTAIAAAAAQTFVFAFTPTAAFGPTDVSLTFLCDNTGAAPQISGVNTLLLSASSTDVPDIVAVAATMSGDGLVTVPGAGDTGAFAVATANVGAGGTITAAADTGQAALPVSLSICQVDPGTGACLGRAGPSATLPMAANSTSAFAIFVHASDVVPFDPAANRVFVRFIDGSGVVRGATSVAVRTR